MRDMLKFKKNSTKPKQAANRTVPNQPPTKQPSNITMNRVWEFINCSFISFINYIYGYMWDDDGLLIATDASVN